MSSTKNAKNKEQPTGSGEQAVTPQPPVSEAVHPLQKLMDNPWLLLVLGILIPVLSYTVWGLIDILLMGPAKLP